MKIRMLKTVPGSLDGIRVTTYEDGKEYDLTDTPGARDLAQAFVGAGMAAEVRTGTTFAVSAGYPETFDAAGYKALFDKTDRAPEIEEKAVEAAPENKAIAAPATKRQYNRKG